jgi:polyisoprenyl-phosphate glycosyltransferase
MILIVSIVTPCFNGEANVDEFHRQVSEQIATLPEYEHIHVGNASTDKTVERSNAIIATDPRVGVIVNDRNFSHIRSPIHGIIQTQGEADMFFIWRLSGLTCAS